MKNWIHKLVELRQCNDIKLLQKLVAARQWNERFDEMAFPAYFRGNALSRALFFGRLARVLTLLPTADFPSALDFGCGLGIMLPWLSARSDEVLAVDLHTDIAKAYASALDLGDHIHFSKCVPGETTGKGFDLIFALDVLEHVEPLDDMIRQLNDLLAPEGLLVISGPTENSLYRLGRRIVGFSGEYHHCDINDIFTIARKTGLIQQQHAFWPLPGPLALFEIGLFTGA